MIGPPLPQFRQAMRLEMALGDPYTPENLVSFANLMEHDEEEAFPRDAFEKLNREGVARYYVPLDLGGSLFSFEELIHLARVVARRDLTLAIAHGKTLLGAMSVWVAGTVSQKKAMAALILGGDLVALGLTEKDHGGDLLACSLEATKCGRTFRLSGEKWLINNASRCRAIVLFARERDPDSAREIHSLFLADKERLASGSFEPLPKIRTLGVRGMDVSGLRFRGAVVPLSARVGPPGAALDITLRSMQVTRTVAAALSLGTADTALRTTLDFAVSRSLYGGSLIDIPSVKHVLAECFAELLGCECLAVAAARAIQAAPERMGVLSAVAKYFIPVTVEELVGRLKVVLGARHYLREEHDWGLFQKLLRDVSLIGLFDGSTAVNLNFLTSQLPRLFQLGSGRRDEPVVDWFRLDCRLPKPDLSSLANRPPCRETLFDAVNDALGDLEGSPPEGILDLAEKLRARVEEIERRARWLASEKGRSLRRSRHAFDLAAAASEAYAIAASCLVWVHNRELFDPRVASGDWLLLFAGTRLNAFPVPRCCELVDRIVPRLLELLAGNRLFSLFPMPLARRARCRDQL